MNAERLIIIRYLRSYKSATSHNNYYTPSCTHTDVSPIAIGLMNIITSMCKLLLSAAIALVILWKADTYSCSEKALFTTIIDKESQQKYISIGLEIPIGIEVIYVHHKCGDIGAVEMLSLYWALRERCMLEGKLSLV